MLNDLKNNVESSVKNSIDPDLIKKLTLQSDELVSERERIDNEERRKEAVRDSLAEILPWETRDAEMEILVDECKEVILGLSSDEETFTGPFVLTGGLGGEGEEDDDDDDAKAAKDLSAAELSAEKLSKLQPIPELLSDFDLDTHVGLIERVLKEDEQLVEMHSRLSSGGERERMFWKNYFFHCAYARYEAGLSIDEIWCPEKQAKIPVASEEESDDYDVVNNSDEEVIFDSASSAAGSRESSSRHDVDFNNSAIASSSAIDGETSQIKKQNTKLAGEPTLSSSTAPLSKVDVAFKPDLSVAHSDSVGGAADYEFVPSAGGDDELDELEAEIAAALGD
jgi:hypothetical protein